MGTLIVALILLAVVLGASASLMRGRKRGECSCGGDCGACAGCAGRAAEHGGKQ